MKKLSFNKLERKNNSTGGFDYIIRSVKPHTEGLTELSNSFIENGFQFDNIDISNLDSQTSLIVSISVIDMDDSTLLQYVRDILNKECKNIFIELSCYDHQEIDIRFYDYCRKNCNKELWFIDKNMLKVADDCLFFEHHCWHTNMYMPKYKESFNQLNDWLEKFQKPHKGLFLAGHIRFHKIELLNYLYENNLLDENFIWSSVDETFQSDNFREFIPQRDDTTYRSFKILERLPNMQDFDLFDEWKYHNYPAHINYMNYFNSYFEVVPETHFYDRTNLPGGTKNTRKDWISISEKTCKALRMNIPFVMLSKANTVKLLTDRFGFDVSLDFWNHDYDLIENDIDRMSAIKSILKSILEMPKNELHDFYYKYFNDKKNYDIFIENFYYKPLNEIWNKF